MSDTKLRELERRWKETGAVEDEAAYLLERVRVGDLTQERLELAAYCGHEGARNCITLRSARREPIDHRAWVDGLDRLSHDGALVFSAALAVEALRWWEVHHGRQIDPRHAKILRKALGQALDALSCKGKWPNFNLVVAADAAVNMLGAEGPADPRSCGAGWTVVTLLRAHSEPDIAMRTFAAASANIDRVLSAPFMSEREALSLGSGAVRRYATEGRTPQLPVPS